MNLIYHTISSIILYGTKNKSLLNEIFSYTRSTRGWQNNARKITVEPKESRFHRNWKPFERNSKKYIAYQEGYKNILTLKIFLKSEYFQDKKNSTMSFSRQATIHQMK